MLLARMERILAAVKACCKNLSEFSRPLTVYCVLGILCWHHVHLTTPLEYIERAEANGMNGVGLGQLLLWAAFLAACWFCYQLFLQNGRLQLRLEVIEQELRAQGIIPDKERDILKGVPAGSLLNDFEMPLLAGGTMTLSQWRGKKVLLIFFNPGCAFCIQMLPELSTLTPNADTRGPVPLIISTGAVEENRRIFEQAGVSHPVLLQEGAEVATLYRVPGTPMGYLVDERGQTATELIAGAEDLLGLLGGIVQHPTQAAQRSSSGKGRRGFSRSLDNSKIKRDGLEAGARAPEFTLPRVDEGELSDPACGPCQELDPKLENLHRKGDVQVLMISRGDTEANRQKVAEHGLTFPVVLQRHWEISRDYGVFSTPVGYLIDEKGLLATSAAMGADAVLNLTAISGSRATAQL
jgi:peroxiredoxin